MIMETQSIDPRFMKALVKCYLLQKEARSKVFHDRRVLKHMLKVFKWKRLIRHDILISKTPIKSEIPPASDRLDQARRNLWLVIVRKDVIQAHKQKMTLKEHRIIESRLIAYKCQSYFHKFHNKPFSC